MNNLEWVATTQTSQWQTKDQLTISPASGSKWDVEAQVDKPLQTIDGFGANFNAWRMPVGANDFSVDWYSYDEVPGDFDLKCFSISKDLETLVPFIKNALKYQPALKLWASAWSPPTWMKYNKHYAGKMSDSDMPPNGLKPEQVAKEGSDQFIQEDRYFSVYTT